tara:strand:- start:15758 stop:17776 length:2019 start_codon:yes stop_codon:yes gene_type:complete
MLNLKDLEIPEIDASDIRDEYTIYESESSEYRNQMAEDEEFFLGKQLSEAQKDYLISVGQPPESNNKIRPAVEQVLSNIASGKPEWDIEPVGDMDGKFASIYNQLMDNIWYNSNGDSQFRSACKDFIVKGISYLHIYPDYHSERGLGALKVKRINPESIFVDPNSSMSDFSDATSIIYSDLHTKESLKISFPDFADEIEEAREDYYRNEITTGKYDRDAIFTRGDETEDAQPKVRKFVRFSKVSIPMAMLTEAASGKQQIFGKEDYKNFTEDPRYDELIKKNAIIEKIVYETKVRETCVIGDVVYYDEILPISNYPIVPACNEYVGTPFPSGDVRHAKSPQRMLNRTEALLISHTSSTTNFKLVVEDGAIDPKELQKWNIPNAVIRANPGALREGKIREFAPPAVSSQLFQEKARYELDIEQVFGAYKYMQGYGGASPGTVGEARIIEDAVSRKQNWKILPIYDMLTNAGKVVVDWIPHVYNQERVLRMTDEYGGMQEVSVNQSVVDRYGDIVKLYDMTSNTVDIRVVIGSTRAKSAEAELQKDLQLLGAGIIDKTQVIMNMKTDIDKQGLLQRMSEISQLSQRVQALEEELKAKDGDLQTRERELFHTKMRAEISEATKPVIQAQSNIKAQAKVESERQRAKTKQVETNLASAEKAVNSEQPASVPDIGIG